jgi:hypothetical protein
MGACNELNFFICLRSGPAAAVTTANGSKRHVCYWLRLGRFDKFDYFRFGTAVVLWSRDDGSVLALDVLLNDKRNAVALHWRERMNVGPANCVVVTYTN